MRSHHGICIPLSSLRSQNCCGIGEFFDLLPLISWCKRVKFDIIQLLPLNDSGFDPSPYFALSSCALDPAYLSLRSLPNAGPLLKELSGFAALSMTQRVEKREVLSQKLQWLKLYFDDHFATVSQTTAYKNFQSENSAWLGPFALFKAIRKEQSYKHWREWPLDLQKPTSRLFGIYSDQIDFEIFLQYLCFSQMGKVRAFAEEESILLKGDIPILLNTDSADVWANRAFFNLDLSAGAPPDLYVPQGQNWGSPIYNWETLREQNFAWWKERLHTAEKLFHLYRIDHIVGFFRLWAIPQGKKATEGHFIPSDKDLWWAHGKEILNMMIDSCCLLPIGEDLGTIPKEVYPILKDLGICGTKVVRWQKTEDGKFIPYSQYEPFSMTTLSTHDMETLELWWKKNPSEVVPFCRFKHWSYHPILSFKQRLELLHDAHHTPSYFHINLLQEYLALFPNLVWPNPEDERINVPGTISPTNWSYRTRPFLEEIVSHEGLQEAISKILN